MYLSLIVLPLLGSITAGFFGRKTGTSGSELITSFCVILTMIISLLTFFEVGFNNIPVFLELFKWVDSESLNVSWGFNFDAVTVSMLIPVLIVSSLVHIYSIGYMSHDPHRQRFFSYLSLFTFMMIILVTANNFLLMFVGWEGVGICSYLLVNFWFTRIAANQSSVSALLTNRVGDCFLTIGMFAILWTFGNLDYATVFSLVPFSSEIIVTLIGVCLLIGAMAKSSQIGLHVWLPMAMEGPTPVSALIHAATMVTAGVYLLIRCSPLIEYSSLVLLLCLWVGAITTVFSSLIGLFQQDIKKVIAYSTMSQLGMMVIAIGLSSYNLALFHLVNHAFYKALLFLAAGGVIHAVSDNQDFRKYGGLRTSLPLSYSVMLIASLSLVAFPFMTGFYSKDLILESSYGEFNFSGIAVYFIATIGAMFTTLYSVKVLHLTFLANPAGPLNNYNKAHEGDIFMSLPLIILAIFSIFFGFIVRDVFIGLGTNFFSDNSIFIHPLHEIMLNTEFAVPTLFKLLPLIFTLLITPFSLLILEFFPKSLIYFKSSRIGYNCYSLFSQRLYMELFYNRYITEVVLKLGGQTTKVLDKGSIELAGPYGLEKGLSFLSVNIAKLDTGVITSYALYILIGLIFYILIPSLALNSLFLIVLLGLVFVNSQRVSDSNSNHLPFENNKLDYIMITIFIILTVVFINLMNESLYASSGSDNTALENIVEANASSNIAIGSSSGQGSEQVNTQPIVDITTQSTPETNTQPAVEANAQVNAETNTDTNSGTEERETHPVERLIEKAHNSLATFCHGHTGAAPDSTQDLSEVSDAEINKQLSTIRFNDGSLDCMIAVTGADRLPCDEQTGNYIDSMRTCIDNLDMEMARLENPDLHDPDLEEAEKVAQKAQAVKLGSVKRSAEAFVDNVDYFVDRK